MVLRRLPSAVLVVSATAVLTGCAADDAGGGDDGPPVDDGLLTVEVMEMYPGALVEGVLSSAPASTERDGALTCWTVTSDEGPATYVLVLPAGSETSDGALRIADSSTWLSAGDPVALGGGEWADPAYEEYADLCGGTGLWLVSPGDAAS